MNSPNSIIETPEMSPAKGAAHDTRQPGATGGRDVETVAPATVVPLLEWAETETYTVAIQEGAAPGDSTAFRLSF